MPKEITDRAPSSADDALADDGREKPGIAYASTSDLRGFPMSPNGTALGIGRSTSQPPLEQPLPGTRFSAEQYAEAEKMVKRLEDGRPHPRDGATPAWPLAAPSQVPQPARDPRNERPTLPMRAGAVRAPAPGPPTGRRTTSTPLPPPRRSVNGLMWLGGAAGALSAGAAIGLALLAHGPSDSPRSQAAPTATPSVTAEAARTQDLTSSVPVSTRPSPVAAMPPSSTTTGSAPPRTPVTPAPISPPRSPPRTAPVSTHERVLDTLDKEDP
jgi:hypothetical protein